MKLNDNALAEYGNNYARLESQWYESDGIDICLIEPVTISTNVEFVPAPIATIGEKLQEFIQNPVLEAANAFTNIYQQSVMTDEYSALILGGNKNVLKFDLKFRTYDDVKTMPYLSTTQSVLRYLTAHAALKTNQAGASFESLGQQIGAAAQKLSEMYDILRGTSDESEVNRAIATSGKINELGYNGPGKNFTLTQIYDYAIERFVTALLSVSKNNISIAQMVACQINDEVYDKDSARSDKKFSADSEETLVVLKDWERYNQSLSNTDDAGTRVELKYRGEEYGLNKFDHTASAPIIINESIMNNDVIYNDDFKVRDAAGNIFDGKTLKNKIDNKKDDFKSLKTTVNDLVKQAYNAAINLPIPETGVSLKEMWLKVQKDLQDDLGDKMKYKKKGTIELIEESVEDPLHFVDANYQADLHELRVVPYEKWLNHLHPTGIYIQRNTDMESHIVVIDRFEFTSDKFGRWCDWNLSVSTHVVPAFK